MEYFAGLVIALAVVGLGRSAGFDKERSFYPLVLTIVAAYYILFAAMAGSAEAFAYETIGLAAFVLVAVVGFRSNLWFVAIGLAVHGTFDFFHADFIENSGVPGWWPMFCLTCDVVLGGYVGLSLVRAGQASGSTKSPRFRERIHPYVEAELLAARAAEADGDAAKGFKHLERAHVLGQASTIEHVRVHVHMLAWGLRNDMREVAWQPLRILGAATKTALGVVPHGNTGGANVSAFRAMDIPSDLAEVIAWATIRDRPMADSVSVPQGSRS